MTVLADQVLADAVGVCTDQIMRVDPDLDLPVVTAVVTAVGGGRVKRRKLAQALLDNPAVLTDGRSPAPRVVGNLLIALRRAGATTIAAPRCTECGKALRSLQRRGEDWYCGVCGPDRQPCADCGKLRRIAARNREDQPLCCDCRPQPDADTDVLIGLVHAADPDLSVEVIRAAITAAVPAAGRRHHLVRIIQAQPDLLTGNGAKAPIPAVLRLIDHLCQAGATGITRPACPHCQRVITLTKMRGGVRLCRNCVAKSRAEQCAGCGVIREPGTRDEHGRALCPRCLITDPANQEDCLTCGRRRPVSVRTPHGPLCPTCRPIKTMTCSICGRLAPAEISQATGQPWCQACQQRWATCTGCGIVNPVRSGTRDQPLCSACTRSDPGFWLTCPTCGTTQQLRKGPCARCIITDRLDQLLRDNTGVLRPDLQALHHALVTTPRPTTVERWLSRQAIADLLRELATGQRPLTHDALDDLGDSKPVKHLRSMLVATGALPARDEYMARIEAWITRTITAHEDPDQRKLLHRFAVWHLLRRLRHRIADKDTTHEQAVTVRQHVRAAIALLDWLNSHGLTLATCSQRDLDTWTASEHTAHHREAGHFIRWAAKNKLTSVNAPAVKWSGPTGIIDTEQRWQQARRLIHDVTIDPDDRFAGLVVLLYAQFPATLSRLTIDDLDISNDQVRLRLGREPIILPEPLDQLARTLIANRRGHATLADHGTSRWLFPGGQPGRHISAYQLGERLRLLGIQPAQARSTALFQLATELPAALLARLLGIHITVAVAWQRASAGDWMRYAADFSRRPR